MATVTRFPSTDTAVSGSWTTPTNVQADDAAVAVNTNSGTKNATSDRHQGGYGFDGVIPSGATINSVQVEVEHRVTGTGNVAFLENAVRVGSTDGTFNSDSAEPTTLTARTYPTQTRPGGGSWTRADLLDGTFFTVLRARNGNNATAYNSEWDYIRVTVDYTVPPVGATIGLAAETDSASSLTPSKALAIGLPAETDAAQSITAGHVLAIGLPVDTETALSIVASKSAALGLAEETDSGLSITGSTTLPAFILSASANITASGENTTAILTAPAGKTTADFGGGRIQDDENPGDTVNLGADEYREDEWCLEATASAEAGEDYEFRVVRSDDTLLDAYTETPIWTVAVGITQAMGLATETDTGQSITPSKAGAIGLASETDSAQSIAASKSTALGLAEESDAALSLNAGKVAAIGIAEEADSAQSLQPTKSAALGLASETDSAQSITPSKALAIGFAEETDTALPITLLVAGQIGLAEEADSAQPIVASKSQAIGLATESDSGLAITAAKQRALGIAEESDSALSIEGEVQGGQFVAIGQAVETDTALSITASKTRTLGLAEETDTAVSISPMKSVGLGFALETDAAFAMVAGKSSTIGFANEIDTALAMTASGGAPLIVFRPTRMVGILISRPGMAGISTSRSRMTGVTVEPEG